MKNIYQMLLTEHFRNPRNGTVLNDYDVALTNVNPLCGDMVNIQLKCANDKVHHIGIQANGCILSVAVASLLSEVVKGKQIDEIAAFDASTVQTLAGTELGPTRLKCALMGLKAIQEGIKKYKGTL
jgi:nitrogen fixation NifU-like protein